MAKIAYLETKNESYKFVQERTKSEMLPGTSSQQIHSDLTHSTVQHLEEGSYLIYDMKGNKVGHVAVLQVEDKLLAHYVS